MEDDNGSSKSFFKHVFNFDDDSKADILNILQYAMLAIIPIIILNKAMQQYVPEADEKKSSIELSAEIIIQIVVMFIGLLLIHRIVTFVPTYSSIRYPEFHIVYIILATLMITTSLQTKLGEKISILADRVWELWNGPKPKKGKGANGVRVSQPISGQMLPQASMGTAMPTSSSEGTSISSLPTYDQSSSQSTPNYDAMYQQNTTPLVGAASPGMEGMTPFEPMAANAVLGGGGSFGTW